MDIAARLKAERERLGLSQTAFGQLGSVGKTTVIAWERGSAFPNAEFLASVADVGVDVQFVVTGKRSGDGDTSAPHARDGSPVEPGALLPAPATQEGAKLLAFVARQGDHEVRYEVVPRYSVKASAGRGRGDVDEEVHGEFAFRADWMRRHLGRAGTGFATIEVHGDSMQPTLLNGEEIVIDSQVRRVDVSGIYVIALRGDLLVKRVQRKLDGSLVVKSDNPAYEPETITAERAEDFRVVGRMVWPRVR